MESKSSRARLFAWGTLLFAVGLVVGGASTSALASRASRAYLLSAQLTFGSAQDEQLSGAWRRHDFDAALGHAFCALESQHGLGAQRAFRSGDMPWNLLSLAFLEYAIVEPNRPTVAKVGPIMEGEARARLAVVWEKLGRQDAADEEWRQVAQLTGTKDLEKWRTLGLDTIDLWSKVRERESALPGSAAAP